MAHTNETKDLVVLLLPNSRWSGKRTWLILPHAALILTALLKDEFDFRILDANSGNLSQDDCEAYLREHKPRAVLVSALAVEYCQQYHDSIALAKRANPAAVTVLGGVYPTVMGEEAVKDRNIDYIFLRHAEERIVPFLRLALAQEHQKVRSLPGVGFLNEEGAAVINPPTGFISDVGTLVKPDYSLLDVDFYVAQTSKDYQFNAKLRSAPIISSYGCPYNCLFCATRTISGTCVAYRPVEDVLEEIEFLMQAHGVQNLAFLDDCLLGDRSRIESMLGTFLDRSYNLTWKAATVSAWHLDDDLLTLMKRSGCTQITISVESGSPRVLHKIIRKPLKLQSVPPIVRKCKELGIDIGANFVIGFPGETWEDLRETFRFPEQCDFDLAHFHIATPLPQTDLYKIADQQGLLPEGF